MNFKMLILMMTFGVMSFPFSSPSYMERGDFVIAESSEKVFVDDRIVMDDLWMDDCPNPTNVALGKTATQSSTFEAAVAGRAVDGSLVSWPPDFFSRTLWESDVWWEIDLGDLYEISSINLFKINGQGFSWFTGVELYIKDNSGGNWELLETIAGAVGEPTTFDYSTVETTARYLRIEKINPGQLGISEVEIFGCLASSEPDPIEIVLVPTNASDETTADGSITTTVSGGTGAYSFNWSNGSTIQNPSGLLPGTYNVTVGDAAGSTATASTLVEWDTPPVDCSSPTNVALGKPATQSSTFEQSVAGRAVDGSIVWWPPDFFSRTLWGAGAWWEVDLGSLHEITSINLFKINNQGYSWFTGIEIYLKDDSGGPWVLLETIEGAIEEPTTLDYSGVSTTGRYLRIEKINPGQLGISEVEIFGCSSTSEPDPVVIELVPNNASGEMVADGSITTTVSGGTAPYTFNWSNGSTVQNPTALFPGTYSVTVEDAVGSTATASTLVEWDTPPNDCSSPTNVALGKTATQSTTFEQSVAGRAVDGSLVTWPPDFFSRTLWQAGTWWELDLGSMHDITSINLFKISTQGDSWFEGIELYLKDDSGGGWVLLETIAGAVEYPSTFDYSSAAITGRYLRIEKINPGQLGISEVEVFGCPSSSEPDPIVIGLVPTNASGETIADGSITTTVSGGTGAYTFNWSNGSTVQNPTGLLPGTYSVTVSDAVGSTATASTVVEWDTPPNDCSSPTNVALGKTATQSTTFEQSVAGRAVDGSLVTWPPDFFSRTLWQAGTWWELDLGSMHDITSINLFKISTQGDSWFEGVEVYLKDDSGGGWVLLETIAGAVEYPSTFDYSSAAITGRYLRIEKINPGQLGISEVEVFGCPSSSEPDPIVIGLVPTNASSETTADGSITTTVSGGTGAYTFNWSNGSTDQNPSGLLPGTYNVTVEDAVGVTATASTVVEWDTPPNDCSNPTNVALGKTATQSTTFEQSVAGRAVDGSIATWPPDFFSRTLWQAGTWWEVDLGAMYEISSINLFKINGQGFSWFTGVEIYVKDDSGGGWVLLETIAGAVEEPTTLDYSGLGTTGRYLRIEKINPGQLGIAEVEVFGCATTAGPELAVTLNPTNPSSPNGTDGTIAAVVTGGEQPYSYFWSSPSMGGALLENLGTGVYSVTVIDGGGNSVIASTELTFEINPLAVQLTPQNASAQNNADGSITTLVSGGWVGSGAYSFNWSNGATDQNPTGLLPGEYSVTVEDAIGNIAYADVFVGWGVNNIAITLDNVVGAICPLSPTGAIEITVAGGAMPYDFLWSNGAISQNLVNIIGGDYGVTVSDANSNTAELTVNVPAGDCSAMLGLSYFVSPVTGPGQSDGAILLDVYGGTPPYTYDWGAYGTSMNLSMIEAGTYDVTVTDFTGMTISETIVVPVDNLTPPGVYHNLVKKLDGSLVYMDGNVIRFKYNEKYQPESNTELTYKIYGPTGVIADNTDEELLNVTTNTTIHDYGINFYQLSTVSLGINYNRAYTIEVTGGNKGEVYYLRFINHCVNCPISNWPPVLED